MNPVQVKFRRDYSAITADGHNLPEKALIFTAPTVIWDGEFVGWDRYARETYDCRHIVNIQYSGERGSKKFEQVRAEIQRLQCLWKNRDEYVKNVLHLAQSVGYATYKRMLIGITATSNDQCLLISSLEGTAEDVATELIANHPDIETALEIAEGGGVGIITGTPSNLEVLDPSNYRRGRVLCCLLIWIKN